MSAQEESEFCVCDAPGQRRVMLEVHQGEPFLTCRDCGELIDVPTDSLSGAVPAIATPIPYGPVYPGPDEIAVRVGVDYELTADTGGSP